jgi:hypothetical protein
MSTQRDLATAQSALDPLFPGVMGVRLTEPASDKVVAEKDVRPQLRTAGGICMEVRTWPLPIRRAPLARS